MVPTSGVICGTDIFACCNKKNSVSENHVSLNLASGKLPVDELVLEPKGAGGTVETYLITALLEPKPNWLANVVIAI